MWWSPPSWTAWRSHSNTLSELPSTGAPNSPGDQSLLPKRSSSRVEKRIEAGCWPVCSTLTAKWFAEVRAAAHAAILWTQTSSSGGSSDTEVKLLAVIPNGRPCESKQVTTVTPVAKQPSASRRVRWSDPVRYSLVWGLRGGSGIAALLATLGAAAKILLRGHDLADLAHPAEIGGADARVGPARVATGDEAVASAEQPLAPRCIRLSPGLAVEHSQ